MFLKSQAFKNANIEQSLLPDGPLYRVDHFEHFGNDITGNSGYLVDNATSGTVTHTDGDMGIIVFDAGAATADQGVQLQDAIESWAAPANGLLCFEAYLKFGTSVTQTQFFGGFAEQDTTLFASGANSTANHIGFEMNAVSQGDNAGYLYFYSEASGNRTTLEAIKQIVVDTWYKIGFQVSKQGKIEVFVDDVNVGEITTNIPTTQMSRSLALLAEGAQGTATVDYWAAYMDPTNTN